MPKLWKCTLKQEMAGHYEGPTFTNFRFISLSFNSGFHI